MPCGAIIYFDEKTDAAIRGLWQVLEDAGVSSKMLELNSPPHMTLLVCDGFKMDRLRPVVNPFVSRCAPQPVTFHSIGIFPGPDGVIYLAPTVTRALLDLHAEFWNLADPYTENENPLYRPEIWVPHITLGYNIPDDKMGLALQALRRVTIPQAGILQDLLIGEFNPGVTGFKELYKVRLGSRPSR